jgi:T5SS/PEP-CTERM-associated repeat protein
LLELDDGAALLSDVANLGTAEGAGFALLAGRCSWVNTNLMVIGAAGSGQLDVTEGSAASTGLARLGELPGAQGTLTVNGAASTFSCGSSLLVVGDSGMGTLQIEAGGAVSADLVSIGANPGSTGEATIIGAGSILNVTGTALYVGNAGEGNLSISAGATVNAGFLIIASEPAGSGTVLVHGPLSLLNVPTNFMAIGAGGAGDLTLESGGQAVCAAAVLGQSPGGSGDATVSGGGSSWTVGGDLSVGRFAPASLSILDGGAVASATGTLGAFAGSHGDAHVAGSGSTWTTDQTLRVGAGGQGILTIADGAVINSLDAYVGEQPASLGHVEIDSAGAPGRPTAWNCAGALIVGHGGLGSVSLINGSSLSSDGAVIGNSALLNTVTLSSGSTWTNSDSLIVGNSAGQGVLAVHSGSSVHSASALIGLNPDLLAVAFVSGPGAQWVNSAQVIVGMSGMGRLTISDGAMVQSAAGVDSTSGGAVGALRGSAGEVLVSGAKSSWNATNGELTIGDSGQGSLTIAGGGMVISNGGLVGRSVGSNGSVMVSGAGSAWSSSQPIIIGGGGSGSVSISDGGQIIASRVEISAAGQLLGHGTIAAPLVTAGRVAPGSAGPSDTDSHGSLSVIGAFTQLREGTLAIDIGGTAKGQFDQLDVSGPVVLGGVLEIQGAPGYIISPGQSFTIVTSDVSVDGAFESVLSDDAYEVIYRGTSVQIIATCGLCSGDMDESCTVDGLDLARLLASWSGARPYSPCPPIAGPDLNGDCRVDGVDLVELLAAWGPCD